jgi:hypothetical protein
MPQGIPAPLTFESVRHSGNPIDVFDPAGTVVILGHQAQRKTVFLRQRHAVDFVGQKDLIGVDSCPNRALCTRCKFNIEAQTCFWIFGLWPKIQATRFAGGC